MGSDIQSEQALLRQFRKLAGPRGDDMRLCDDMASCDLLVVDERSAMRQAVLRLATARPQVPLWLLDSGGSLREADGSAPEPLSDEFIRRTLGVLGGSPAVADVDAATETAGDVGALVKLLRTRLAARSGSDALRMDGRHVLLLDYANSSAILLDISPDEIGDRLAEGSPGLALEALPPPQLEAAAGSRARRPLVALLWQIGQRVATQTRGWAMAGLADDVALRLQKWPDFRVLAHHHDDFRMCSILVRQAATPPACAQLLDLDPLAVRVFFHAAYLSGAAAATDVLAQPPVAPQKRVSALAGLWRSVRLRMGG